ncbi:unnamed protein product [Thelazia callipaeda]|uniref:C2H2-type domain-containing protein n=1 Tax=Thelazia callipaeda TaxID=103827 RepID=A0A0N5CSU0_THECL|nr:unnamed protein product [Thelazia callipaeda]
MVHHERKYECEKCARTFVSEKRMRAHELKKHSAMDSDLINRNSNGRKLFECNQCDRTYETFYNFKEHLAKHKGKLFRCTICNKHLSGQSALSRHSKIHEKPHECMMCTSRFSSAYDLDCHFSYYHSTIKRFKCFHCDRVLYNYSGKLRHERLCSLKNVSIKKASPNDSQILTSTVLSTENSNLKIQNRIETLQMNDNKNIKYEGMQSKPIIDQNLLSKSEFCAIKNESESYSQNEQFLRLPKPQKRKTFHIRDIMHDVPGFSQ